MSPIFKSAPIALLIMVSLAGSAAVAQTSPAPTTTPIETPRSALNLDTPLEQVAADPAGRAVLEKDMPLLLKNERWASFKAMSLNQLATALGGRIPAERIKMVEQDLAALDKR